MHFRLSLHVSNILMKTRQVKSERGGTDMPRNSFALPGTLSTSGM